MTRRLRTLFSLALILFPSFLRANTTINSPMDIQDIVSRRNLDIQLLRESTRQVESILLRIQGAYYTPTIKAEAGYIDDNHQPPDPFQPAHLKHTYWKFLLESAFPAGIQLQAGKTFLRSYFGQSVPPNTVLPYPATYYMPEVFVAANLSLTRDFLGYLSQKNLKSAALDLSISKRQERLLQHRLTLAALTLYYQLPILKQIRTLSTTMIDYFRELEVLLRDKSDKMLVEKSDLYKAQSVIAQEEARVSGSDTVLVEVEKSLGILLGDAKIEVAAYPNLGEVSRKISACEAQVLKTPFNDSLSEETLILADQRARADLQARIARRQVIPDVNLTGRVSSTGTDTSFDKAMDDIGNFDQPVYEIGLNLTWQPSAKIFRSARQAATAAINSARDLQEKRLVEQESAWKSTRSLVPLLRKKQTSLNQSIDRSRLEMQDLDQQYRSGRLSFFQLTQERAAFLATNIEALSVIQERLANLLQNLQTFDQFSCELLP